MNIFDPHTIARIERLEIRARRLVEGYIIGIHRSPYRGISTDFAEHRHYVQGDDTRHLDWKIFARSDRYYVKKYEQDTNLEARFLLDCSKSMFFKSDEAAMSKFEYGATMIASLGYLLHKQRDAIGLTLFDTDMRTTLPPRATYSHFRHMAETMEKATPGGDTGLAKVLKKVGMQIGRRGLVVVVSDFIDDVSALGEALGLHDTEGNEVILFRRGGSRGADISISRAIGAGGDGKRRKAFVRSSRFAESLFGRTHPACGWTLSCLPTAWLHG